MVVPLGSGVVAGGSVPITLSLGTVSLGVGTTCTRNDFWPRRLAATVASWLDTSGTGTGGSFATCTVTLGVVLGTAAPAAGSVLSTVPGGLSLSAGLKVGVRCTLASAACAASRVWPTTSGMVTLGLLTVTVMVPPLAILLPACGRCASTRSAGWLGAGSSTRITL